MKNHSSLEPLESRIAPAGIVTVTVTAGVLHLQGDAAANDLTVEAAFPGMITITGNNSTMITFGAVTDTTASVTVPVTSLTSDLGGDNDVLTLNHLNLSKGVTLTDNAGNNTFSITDLRTGADLSITTGAGDDTISLIGNTLIAKAVKLTAGDGTNQATVNASDFEGTSLSYTGGSGADTFNKTNGDLQLTGALTLDMGAGANDVEVTTASMVVKGAVSIKQGTHNMGTSITNFSATIAQYKSTVTISYVDGTNTTTVGSSYDLSETGLLKIVGGTGDDTINLNGGSLAFAGGINIAGGDGVNTLLFNPTILSAKMLTYVGGATTDSLTVNGTSVAVAGAISISGADGANTFSLQPSALSAKTLTYVGGAATDAVTVGGSYSTLSGLVSVNLGEGTNTFTSAGTVSYNGGLTVMGGSAVDTVNLQSVIFAKSITLRLGDGADILYHNGTYLTVSGLADYGLGDGSNSISGYFYSTSYNGGLKVTAGSGDDTLTISANNLHLGKGATFDGGAGTNTLDLTAVLLDSAADISFTNGVHATGTSFAGIDASRITLQKGVTAKFGDGADHVRIAGSSSVQIVGGVTVLAPGLGATDVDLNGPSFSIAGKLTVTGGNDGFDVSTAVNYLNLGSVQLTGGTGNDTVNFNAEGQIGALTLALGAGTSNVTLRGQHDGLTIKGALGITTTSRNNDSDNLTLANLYLLGATTITQGAGTGNLGFDNLLAAALTINTGAGADTINFETSNSGIVSTVTGAVNIMLGSGLNYLTFGANADLAKINFKSTVKITGGSETDTVSILNNGNIFASMPVLTNIP